ncbi:DNA primase [Streptomyces sp. SID13666]|uniref:bifunctional DNA primase/polymerase n=1 Tax=unclassified Streptomyces TaxID=2593676 RepID=UPI0013BF7714|nr:MULTISPECIES: bifunctional DNA primase/polymerase [unclassified Streptomyces]NEA57998.1 DNA primase [Streptomyces sp. SID13666]NEA72857.1 DNA primase [Streptomyces sp. SID13588]
MREILGRRRKLSFRWRGQSALLSAVLTYTEQWKWPVVPGVGHDRRGSWRAAGAQPCACPRPDCPVPGVHPHDPGLMAATRDPRMVRWWWTARPDAPVVLATGDRVSAVSLPAVAGARALDTLDRLGVRLGPVVATPTRFVLLVAPYSLEELGELLDSHEWVPSSLRYHGEGGYVALPPSSSSAGQLRWIRPPVVDDGATSPWLPSVALIVDTLVRAGRTAPDGTHLTY